MLYPQTNLTQNFTFLWNKTVFIEGSYANMDRLDDMEKWNVGQINTFGGDGKIFELSWTLTTQDSGIFSRMSGRGDEEGGEEEEVSEAGDRGNNN